MSAGTAPRGAERPGPKRPRSVVVAALELLAAAAPARVVGLQHGSSVGVGRDRIVREDRGRAPVRLAEARRRHDRRHDHHPHQVPSPCPPTPATSWCTASPPEPEPSRGTRGSRGLRAAEAHRRPHHVVGGHPAGATKQRSRAGCGRRPSPRPPAPLECRRRSGTRARPAPGGHPGAEARRAAREGTAPGRCGQRDVGLRAVVIAAPAGLRRLRSRAGVALLRST